jgi:hypothetical protein
MKMLSIEEILRTILLPASADTVSLLPPLLQNKLRQRVDNWQLKVENGSFAHARLCLLHHKLTIDS